MIVGRALRAAIAALSFAALLTSCIARPARTDQVAIRQPPFTPDSGSVAVRCGRLIDGVHAEPLVDALVEIRDGRIVSVAGNVETIDVYSTNLPVLDLRRHTCLPGLIDLHTHLTDRADDTEDLRVYFTRSDEETQRIGRDNAAATVLAGFTSVRNVGTYQMGADFALRDAINRGVVLGPRMQASGPYLTIPHGGGDLYVPNYLEPEGSERFHAGVSRGPVQFRERAQMLIDSGADLLKVIVSGAVLAFGSDPGAAEMTPDEVRAVVEVAHAAGKRVAAHAHGAESIRMAIAAGVDTVEHASYLDDAGIVAAKRAHVGLAMDVYNGDYTDTVGRQQKWPEEFLRKNLETTEVQRQAFTKAVAAGAPIVFATDAGVFPHGLNARQFRIMVARGMTPMQAIQSATRVAALFMDWAGEVGTIAPGKFGDLIAVRGDPLADITLLEHVEAVVKGGLTVKRPPD